MEVLTINYNLTFPIENYAALYLSIVRRMDTEVALSRVMPRESVQYRTKAERSALIAEAKILIAQGYSVRKAASIMEIKRSTLVWWLKMEALSNG